MFFNVPHDYKGATPATLSFLDATGKTIRSFTLHLRDKREKKLSPIEIAGLDRDSQVAYGMHRLTAIDPGMNAFQWDLRYAPATEVHGLHLETTDDFSDAMNGPTALPGEYSAEFAYGGKTLKQPLHIALDPRLHSDPYLVALRDAQEHAAEIAAHRAVAWSHHERASADTAAYVDDAYESAVRKAAAQFGMSATDVQIEGGAVSSGQ